MSVTTRCRRACASPISRSAAFLSLMSRKTRMQPCDAAVRVADRRRAVVDRRLRAVAPDQQGVVGQADDDAVAKRARSPGSRPARASTSLTMRNTASQRLPLRFLGAPAGERLGDRG